MELSEFEKRVLEDEELVKRIEEAGPDDEGLVELDLDELP